MEQRMDLRDAWHRVFNHRELSRAPTRFRLRALGMAAALTVVLWDPAAWAINGILSQDLPVLIEIASTEAASYTELTAILTEAAATAASVKEYTDIAKTAYRGVEELRDLTWDDLRAGVVEGVGNAVPEVGQIYGDVQDIRDLRRVSPQSVATLRGILWAEVYGPAIEYLQQQQENAEAVAETKDLRARHAGVIEGMRAELESYAKDCEKGAGACQAAAHKATIKQTELLTDMHEATMLDLKMQERARQTEDSKEVARWYQLERLLSDLNEDMAAALGIDPESTGCTAGRCLYEKYAEEPNRRMTDYRSQRQR